MASTTAKKRASFRPYWLKEAIDELDYYPAQFTREFMKKHRIKIPPAKTKEAMLTRIRRKINSPKARLKFEDLVEYLDEKRLWGRQCVVFYSLKYKRRKYLKKLINPIYIKGCLGKNLEDRYNNNVPRWESRRPFLSEVKRNFDYKNKRGWLSFKWIQTRHFLAFDGPILMQFDERAVNFFIINLADGSAQLRIQSLPNKSLTTLGKEIRTYKKEIRKLLDFHHFSPVPLKPVMQEFLFKKVLPIAFWSVRTQEGKLVGYKQSPPFIQRRLSLPLQGITPREIRVYWENQQEVGKKGRIFFTLKARDNAIVFNAITDKSKEDHILSKLLEVGKSHSDNKEIKKTIDVSEIIKPPPPPKISKDGLLGVAEKNVEGTPHESLKKAAVETAILPALALVRVLFHIITDWLGPTLMEQITNVPFVVVELIVYGFLLFIFYGGGRVRKFFFKIPPKYATRVIKIILGESAELIFNSREYDKWLKSEAV